MELSHLNPANHFTPEGPSYSDDANTQVPIVVIDQRSRLSKWVWIVGAVVVGTAILIIGLILGVIQHPLPNPKEDFYKLPEGYHPLQESLINPL